MTIQTQSGAGNTVVRIRLSPPELGDVRVSLQQTSAGVVARVVAAHPAAAQTLAQSAGDLRRALESSGVSLLQLDIGASGSESGAAGGNGDPSRSSARGAEGSAATVADEPDPGDETPRALRLSSGAVVDVLA